MKASSLRGMAVIAIEGAKRAGEIEELLIDTNAQRIVALRLKTSSPTEPPVIAIEDVRHIGQDAVTLENSADLLERGRSSGTAAEVQQQIVPMEQLKGAKVLTYSGDLIGVVADLDFDPSTYQITEYEVSTGLLADITRNRKMLRAGPQVQFGKGILTAPDEEKAA